MKYLIDYRIFESMSPDETFSEIDGSELTRILSGEEIDIGGNYDAQVVVNYRSRNWLDFTDNEFSEIVKILGKDNVKMNGDVFKLRWRQRMEFGPIWVENMEFGGTIFKFEDEWYYIRTYFGKNQCDYRCDQFEGVIDCLKSFVGSSKLEKFSISDVEIDNKLLYKKLSGEEIISLRDLLLDSDTHYEIPTENEKSLLKKAGLEMGSFYYGSGKRVIKLSDDWWVACSGRTRLSPIGYYYLCDTIQGVLNSPINKLD